MNEAEEDRHSRIHSTLPAKQVLPGTESNLAKVVAASASERRLVEGVAASASPSTSLGTLSRFDKLKAPGLSRGLSNGRPGLPTSNPLAGARGHGKGAASQESREQARFCHSHREDIVQT